MSLLAGHTVLVVDTETTGLEYGPPGNDRITDVAALPLVNGDVQEGWSSLVNPRRPIPEFVVKLTGITDVMVAGAPSVAEVGLRLRTACGDLPLVSHNAPFDLQFLRPMFQEAGVAALTNPVIDTLGLARGLPGVGSNRLEELAARCGWPSHEEQKHRAMHDARLTAFVLIKLAQRWERERGVRSLLELAAISQDVMRTTMRR